MAMFEIEDSEDAKLLRCKTDTETLIKGKGLHRLHAEDCQAAHKPSPPEKRTAWKVAAWVMSIVSAVIAAFIIKWFGFD
ncbi:hypothetical protein [Pseudomonas putida]|jgi:hypothetical protein